MESVGADVGKAYYLYAIIPTAGCVGVMRILADDLHLIEVGAFSVIARRISETSFLHRDRQYLMQWLLSHQQTIESAMAHTPLLPFKFGTIAPDRVSAERCLADNAEKFAVSFEQLVGKIQFEILVMWDLDEIFEEITVSPEIVRRKSELASPGSLDQAAALKTGMIVKSLLERKRSEVSRVISTALREISVDSVENVVIDDRLVLSMVLLVEQGAIGGLETCLAELDAAYGGKFKFRCIGPLPPNAFAMIELSSLTTEAIAIARDVLGLSGSEGIEEVRAVYRRVAKQVHPDVTGARDAEEKIRELNDAYKTLCTYAEAGGPVTVSIRRQEPVAVGTSI